MSREVRRVPLDFNAPLDQVWPGYIVPEQLRANPCPDCENGYSLAAALLFDRWYGNAPFDPRYTGYTPLTPDTPAVRARAERNVNSAPLFYGFSEQAIRREAQRLADLFNAQWAHHLTQDDVDALVAAGRLMDFTHTWTRETGWQPIEPAPVVTAAQVNEWSLSGFGHDSINASVVIEARCKRDGVDPICPTCQGHATVDAYPGQRVDREAWHETEPPSGDGWQLWTTVTEGSPISPVFASAGELAAWMSSDANPRGMDRVDYDTALRFVQAGWAPSMVGTAAGIVSGVEFVGRETAT